jgi:uncharacterized membrane protein
LRIELGLVAAPGFPTDLAEQLAEELPELLTARVDDGVEWSIPTVTEPLLADPAHGGIEVIDVARERMRAEGWDMAVCISDLPLRIGRRPVVAHASATHRVALLSLPALGALHMHRRAQDAIVRLVDGLMGESLELNRRSGSDRRLRVARRLLELAAPIRRETADDDDDIDLRFVAAVVRGHLRLLAGMVRTNRPWRLIARLSRALAGALAAVVFALVTSDVWRIADHAGWGSLLVLSVGVLTGTVVWLVVAHALWERASDRRDREQVVLFNTATTLTVSIGVVTLYAVLFAITLGVARLLIDPGLLGSELGHQAGLTTYATLDWMISSLATVGGALGSALESDAAVREAAYGYRPERRTERDAVEVA